MGTFVQDTNKHSAWLELCRLPNVFTAMADPLAGAMIVGAAKGHPAGVVLLMLASGCLSTGGIVLNDWCDYKKDLTERPNRPLPSKRIRRFYALLLAIALLALGIMLASLAGRTPVRVAGLLVAAISLYDIVLKDIPIAPAVMGACRSLNLLLGMVLVPTADWTWTCDGRVCVFFLAVTGVYITGATLFARRQAGRIESKDLVISSIVTWAAIIAAGITPLCFRGRGLQMAGKLWIVLLLAGVGYRMTQAVLTPAPITVQRAVKTAILGVILLDAGMAAFVCGLPVSLLVVALLIPAIWSGRRLAATC